MIDDKIFLLQPIRAVQHAKEMIEKDNAENRPNTLIGVVGASISSVTLPLSVATFAMNIPLVSYASTNRKLSKHKVSNGNRMIDNICNGCLDVCSHCNF